MTDSWRLLVPLVGIIGVYAAGSGHHLSDGQDRRLQGAPSVDGACEYSDWRSVEFDIGNSTWVRLPTSAARGSRVVLAGVDLDVELDSRYETRGLVVMDRGQRILTPAPQDALHPKISLGRDGVLHLTWASPSKMVGEAGWWSPPFRQAYYSRLEIGGSWIDPTPVFDSRFGIIWEGRTTDIALDREGFVHLVAMSPPYVMHVVLGEHAPRADSIEGLFSKYSSITTRAGAVSIAVSGFIPGVPSSDAIYVTSTDGSSWTPPVEILDSRLTLNQDVRIRSHGDRTHLLWLAAEEGAMVPTVLTHTWSSDLVDWQGPHVQSFSAAHLSALQAEVDRCGALHVVFRADRGQGPTVFYVRATRDGPGDVMELTQGEFGLDPTLAVSDSLVAVTFTAFEASSPPVPDGVRLRLLEIF